MLQITLEQNGKTYVKRFFVIDSHSHMGKDVDGAEMMNPMSPGTGTFDFWTKIEGQLEREWQEGKLEKTFTARIKGVPSKITLDFIQNPVISGIYKALQDRNKSGNYSEFFDRIKHQRLVDMAVCFPFQDQFRAKRPEALYRASNINIHRQTSRFPVSMRMIGYMRCDPMEGEKAVNEVEYWASNPLSNIRGLKLHPRSEGWIDHIASDKAMRVLVKAAEHNFPVIFDTRGKQSILDIADLIRMTRNYLKNNRPELIDSFKVIIAHAGQGNVDDYDVYRAITQPNTWMDLSMLHGKGAENFLSSFRNWCIANRVEERTGRKWSEFCLFATDYPYFGDQHAKELIKFLFNQSFFENGGTLEDSQNILGLNQIKLLPEYGKNARGKIKSQNTKSPSVFIQDTSLVPANTPNRPKSPLTAEALKYNTLAALIEDGYLEIHRFLPQLSGDWRNWEGEFCLITSSKKNAALKNTPIPLIVNKIHPEKLNFMGVLPKGYEWNPMGYKYFDPKTREMFHDMFRTNYPAFNPDDAVKMLAQGFI